MSLLDATWGTKRKIDAVCVTDDIDVNKVVKKVNAGCGEIDHKKYITNENNTIYFHTSVDKESILALQAKINEVIKKLKISVQIASDANCTVVYPPIILNIFSPGGSVFAAFSFIDYMTGVKRANPCIKFHTVITGGSASAATLISVCGDKRYITEYGYMLIHQLAGVHWGKFNELEDDMKNSTSLMNRIRSIYKKHSQVPEDKLDEILKHDLYWNAKKCLKMGLVDEIL